MELSDPERSPLLARRGDRAELQVYFVAVARVNITPEPDDIAS